MRTSDAAHALEELRRLWDCGVMQVSSGALGMNMRRHPLDVEEAAAIAAVLGLEWDGAWIVLRTRP